jgi:uncharacterized membrane protein YbhN (UPF0104 family)
MLVGLAQYEKEELLASLLIFRVLYFILPFMLALGLLGVRELVLGAKAAGAVGGCDAPDRPSP